MKKRISKKNDVAKKETAPLPEVKIAKVEEPIKKKETDLVKATTSKMTVQGEKGVRVVTEKEDAKKASSATEPVKEPVKAPVKETVKEPVKAPVKETVKEPVKAPVKETVKEPVKAPVKETVKEPVKAPVKETVKESVKEVAKEKVAPKNEEQIAAQKAEKRKAAAVKAAATRKANAAKKAAQTTVDEVVSPKERLTPPVESGKETEKKPTKQKESKQNTKKEKVTSEAIPAQEVIAADVSLKESVDAVEKTRVLVIGAECAPFAKTGGLADVIGTLPKELNKLGMDVRVMIPYHRVIKDKYFNQTEHVCHFYANLGWRSLYVGIEKLVYNDVVFYFVDNEEFFGGPIYKGGEAEGEQYAFFCRAVAESMDQIGFAPQIIHANDWHTGMIPMLLKVQYQHRPQGWAKTVFTIHNLMYQGEFSFTQIQDWLGIEDKYNTPEFMKNFECASFMKAALVFADRLSTVSPSYAQEIRMPYYACRLGGILNARANDTWGIVNGINMEEFNPETDICMDHHFNADNLSGKFRVKEDLMAELGLNVWGATPLIGMVTRLTSQKGIDLVMQVFDELMQQDVSVVVLGTGDKKYEDFLRYMEHKYKGRVCAYIGYNNDIAHRIYAASDLFLMPSKFEPCGISQMIAQRYGTLPIVRETGGLKDTVVPYNEYDNTGNGFSFANLNGTEMLNVIKYALWVLRDEQKRTNLVKRALNTNNSFAISAKKYYDMFMGLL